MTLPFTPGLGAGDVERPGLTRAEVGVRVLMEATVQYFCAGCTSWRRWGSLIPIGARMAREVFATDSMCSAKVLHGGALGVLRVAAGAM